MPDIDMNTPVRAFLPGRLAELFQAMGFGDEVDMHRARLRTQKASLVAYLHAKMDAEDWHAVQDAASDIREIEAVLKVLHAS